MLKGGILMRIPDYQNVHGVKDLNHWTKKTRRVNKTHEDEFEQELSMLDQDVKVVVSVEDKPNRGESTPGCSTKHFADGFHEGRWEDDMKDNKRPSLLDETPTDGYANLRGC